MTATDAGRRPRVEQTAPVRVFPPLVLQVSIISWISYFWARRHQRRRQRASPLNATCGAAGQIGAKIGRGTTQMSGVVEREASRTASALDAAFLGVLIAVLVAPQLKAQTRTFPAGIEPVAITFDGTNIWVANEGGNTVTKLLAATGALVGTYPVGVYPSSLAFDGTNIWVTNAGSNTVTKLLGATGAPVGTYPVGAYPSGIAFDGTNIWVANSNGVSGGNTVTKLLAATGALVGTYPVGPSPSSVAFDGTNIWVANEGGDTVTKLLAATGALVGTYAVGPEPSGLVVARANIWVANGSAGANYPGGNTVTKLLAATGAVVGTYPVGTYPVGVTFDGTNIWVANYYGNSVTKLLASTGALLGTYAAGPGPLGLTFDGTNIWVTGSGVTEIGPASPTIPTPQTITFSALSNRTLGSGSFALTATASSGLTVTFAFNSPSVCTASGVTVALVATGTCSITASQSGNSLYGAATPVTQTFTVTQTVTTTTLTSSANPSIFGQSVSLMATVTPSAATGSITFRDGSTILNTVALSGGSAALSISSLITGPHSLTATYVGNANDASSVSVTLTQQINQIVSNIGLTSSLNPSTFGTSVALTARVSPSTATGTVAFLDGTTKLGTGSLSNGATAFVISSLSVGAHSLTALYGGDNNDAGSTSSVLIETVNQVTKTVTTTSLISSANPSIVGQSIRLTATVTPSTATGALTFNDGAATLGTANLSAGTATFSTTVLSQGSHSLTAVYGGDANDAGSTSTNLSQTVNQPVTVQPRVGGLLTCAPVTISGPYGYGISGSIPTSAGIVLFADYGNLIADGKGSFTGSSTTSTGGTIVARSISGTYSINSNCTGAATFRDSLGNTLHLSFTVVDNGNEIEFIQTDSGTVVSGTAQRAPTGCDAFAISGTYTYAISGWIAVGGLFQSFADAGRIVADGSGNFSGKSTYSASGKIIRRTLTGTYSVGSSCSGMATLKDNYGNVDTLAVTVLSNGQLLFIQSDAGTVLSGGAQRGQYACSTASLTGPYVYSIEGFNISGTGSIIPAADSGMYTSDGNGHFRGADAISVGGTVVSRTVSGSYTVNSDCTGSAIFTDTLGNSADLDLFVANGGIQVRFIQTDSGIVLSGSARQQSSGSCSNAILNGSYGFAIEGWTFGSSVVPFADSGQLAADGAGRLSGADTASAGGTIIDRVLSGSYQVNSDCSGSLLLRDSIGDTAHFYLTASSDGRQARFIQTDSGTVISGAAHRQLAFSSDGIVNAASYAPDAVVPGSLFAIFGDALSPGIANAGALPWPTELGPTSVSVNGIGVPLYYVSPTQINGQLPLEVQPGPAQLVVSDGLTSTPVVFNVANAWPGIFTYGLSRAIAVNPDGSLNGPTAPAHSGDIIVVYLTGGGPVNHSGTWITGAASPSGLSSVTLPFTVTIGGIPASVDYLGLTPTDVGLYQLNVHVPTLPAGDQTLVVTIGGNNSNSALISVAP